MTDENKDFGDVVPDEAEALPPATKKSLTASGAKDESGTTDD